MSYQRFVLMGMSIRPGVRHHVHFITSVMAGCGSVWHTVQVAPRFIPLDSSMSRRPQFVPLFILSTVSGRPLSSAHISMFYQPEPESC